MFWRRFPGRVFRVRDVLTRARVRRDQLATPNALMHPGRHLVGRRRVRPGDDELEIGDRASHRHEQLRGAERVELAGIPGIHVHVAVVAVDQADATAQQGPGLRAAYVLCAEKRSTPLTPLRLRPPLRLADGVPAA